MGRTLITVYGFVAYAAFLAVFVYFIGFVEGLVVPKGVDDGVERAAWLAVLVDVGLISLFGIQHSVMARPAFKTRWRRFVPKPAERATYVAVSTVTLALVMWLWQPVPETIWTVKPQPWRGIVYGVSFAGWGILLLATFLIDHFDLFGVKQVVRHQQGKEQTHPRFQTPLLYRYVRHPLLLGFLIAFWAAPTMTVGRLVLAAGMTAYILVAVRYEERDLVAYHGEQYRRYREQVPMLVPKPGATAADSKDLDN
ncbi:MAG: isoprenylcysteine carboxylmethyltransferase family protein [Nitriliruptorales bacterium]|nr:isoprenylcysteine carboxylmethyltransferase family protein [Nitriliruptorales bacterium]